MAIMLNISLCLHISHRALTSSFQKQNTMACIRLSCHRASLKVKFVPSFTGAVRQHLPQAAGWGGTLHSGRWRSAKGHWDSKDHTAANTHVIKKNDDDDNNKGMTDSSVSCITQILSSLQSLCAQEIFDHQSSRNFMSSACVRQLFESKMTKGAQWTKNHLLINILINSHAYKYKLKSCLV